ncbi:MAG: hypothetical protein AAAFM81_00700 [Pseudomonadota bacterium]
MRKTTLLFLAVSFGVAACNAAQQSTDTEASAESLRPPTNGPAVGPSIANTGAYATAMCYLLSNDVTTAGFRLTAAGQAPSGVFIVETADAKQGTASKTITTLANGEPSPGGIVTFDAATDTDNGIMTGRHRWSFNLRSATFLGDVDQAIEQSMTLQRLNCGALERSMDFSITR